MEDYRPGVLEGFGDHDSLYSQCTLVQERDFWTTMFELIGDSVGNRVTLTTWSVLSLEYHSETCWRREDGVIECTGTWHGRAGMM